MRSWALASAVMAALWTAGAAGAAPGRKQIFLRRQRATSACTRMARRQQRLTVGGEDGTTADRAVSPGDSHAAPFFRFRHPARLRPRQRRLRRPNAPPAHGPGAQPAGTQFGFLRLAAAGAAGPGARGQEGRIGTGPAPACCRAHAVAGRALISNLLALAADLTQIGSEAAFVSLDERFLARLQTGNPIQPE